MHEELAALVRSCEALAMAGGSIIAIASEKGGVGKSTLAASLAIHWHRQGLRVLAVDLDPQGTLQDWAAVAEANEVDGPYVIGMADHVRKTVPALADQHDITILDCPGRMDSRLVSALAVADYALVPVAPGAPDAWALSRVLEKIQEMQEHRPELRAGVVVNRAIRTRVASTVVNQLSEVTNIAHCPVQVGNRAPVAEAIAAGSGVTVYDSGSVASMEVRRLADWLRAEISAAAGESAA